MITLATAVKALLAAPRAVKWLARSPLQDQFDAAAAQVIQDTNQESHAVCRAIVAHAMEREPQSEDVDQFMAAAAQDPAFPYRVYRLLGEMRRSADQRRRLYLASMLFGLSFKALPDDERDRVDMAVERMMPGDVELLVRIAEAGKTLVVIPTVRYSGLGPAKVFVLMKGSEVRLATSADEVEGELRDEVLRDDVFRVDRVALAALESVGCIHRLDTERSIESEGHRWQEYEVLVTVVGELVIQAIEQVRPGFEAKV